MRSPDELTTLFRARSLKVTPQRRAVFEAFDGGGGHPTADVIWSRVRDHMPTVSLRTVYQVLNDLVELGEVQAVSVGNGAWRFDPNTAGHDHFVCRSCERIYDVIASRPRVVTRYPGLDKSAGSGGGDGSAGYTVDTVEIIFRGLCASCGG
jgi:Fur family transcriptional regulator, peroxide stress response regulator